MKKNYEIKHKNYCGIDLHTKTAYVCISDAAGKILVHKQIKAEPISLMAVIKPHLNDLVICCECMFTWYWVADFCAEHNLKFVLANAQYLKLITGGKTKNDKIDSYKITKLLFSGMLPRAYAYPRKMRATRDLLRRRRVFVRKNAELKTHTKIVNHQYNLPLISSNLTNQSLHEAVLEPFSDSSARLNVENNLDTIIFYTKQIKIIETAIKKQVKIDDKQSFMLLKTIKGVGDILALTLLYEIHKVERFTTVKNFASYCLLVKCKNESAGKIYGTSGNKIGNEYLQWAFLEAAMFFLRFNVVAQKKHAQYANKYGPKKALNMLAHKLARVVYFMLKQKKEFDEAIFFSSY
jgi:transposase